MVEPSLLVNELEAALGTEWARLLAEVMLRRGDGSLST